MSSITSGGATTMDNKANMATTMDNKANMATAMDNKATAISASSTPHTTQDVYAIRLRRFHPDDHEEFNNRTDESLAKRNQFASEVATQAKLFSGYPFGGYVRDHLIRGMNKWKDMDLWFRSEDQVNQFLAHAKNTMSWLIDNDLFDTINPIRDMYNDEPIFDYKFHAKNQWLKHLYPFQRMTVYIYRKYDDLKDMVYSNYDPDSCFLLDIVISEHFPTNDFDVNCLYYCGGVDEYQSGFPYRFQTEEVIRQIQLGIATELEEYNKYIEKKRHDLFMAKTRFKMMSDRGFKIIEHPTRAMAKNNDNKLQVNKPSSTSSDDVDRTLLISSAQEPQQVIKKRKLNDDRDDDKKEVETAPQKEKKKTLDSSMTVVDKY
jgi:hypothetical protein